MIDLLARAPFPPFPHQVVGVSALTTWSDPAKGRLIPGVFALFDDMGLGKTKTVIDSAMVLFTRGAIRRVVIVTPAAVSSVWVDPLLGELRKHRWPGVPLRVTFLTADPETWTFDWDDHAGGLDVIVTHYEFIRRTVPAAGPRRTRRQPPQWQHLPALARLCDAHTWLVCDESACVKNPTSLQHKAVRVLRRRCGRVTILNGTPVGNNLMDLYAQSAILDPAILGCASAFQFRSRYAEMGGFKGKEILAWRPGALEAITQAMAPYVLRREIGTVALPERLPPITLTVTLSRATWAAYTAMRDDLLVWLSAATASLAPQAITKVLRLAQITSGFVGGVVDVTGEEGAPEPEWEHEVGREKLDAWLAWLRMHLDAEPHAKVLVFSRHTAEIRRALRETAAKFPLVALGALMGDQTAAERTAALHLLDPATAPAGPVVVIGNQQTGGLGLNLTAASVLVRLSHDYSHLRRAQADARIHRPGQTRVTRYVDIVAHGPGHERTIDHVILEALRAKEDLASRTCAGWLHALTSK